MGRAGSEVPEQGDLFAGSGYDVAGAVTTVPHASLSVDLRRIDDADLLTALSVAGSRDCQAYADEAVRRHLPAAVPALSALCSRFKGFGLSRPVREQTVALAALAAIGGPEAADAVARLLAGDVVAEPGLPFALDAAIRLKARLPISIVRDNLDAAEPDLRARACRCAVFWPSTAPRLIELLDDLHRDVSREAAIALGLMGRPEAMATLIHLVKDEPSPETIDALAAIGDDDCFVALGRVAEVWPDLRHHVAQALADSEHRLAMTILRRIDPGRTTIARDRD
ncbi:HEAT repeat domain-containing protein [Acidiphilium sp.]|uniref:HEAT repeat domain-containing protein n=1 Tax=Acidiphilium sp. TaxID=527 RepID=UPI003D02CC26